MQIVSEVRYIFFCLKKLFSYIFCKSWPDVTIVSCRFMYETKNNTSISRNLDKQSGSVVAQWLSA